LLEVRDRLADALPRKPIEAPKDQHVKLAVFGCLEHLVERLPLPSSFPTGLVVATSGAFKKIHPGIPFTAMGTVSVTF
jgi:hypothetical protein